MYITGLDHLVLTVEDIDETLSFYSTVLGMKQVSFDHNRKALQFGNQKINLHQQGDEIKPHAALPLPGSADLCFIADIPLEQVINHLLSCEVTILDGPATRTGASNPILSVYIRDPDGNLIEIANHTE
jgi:catechol 2,3-dioxygenase-like lactoylglutathione lyase family enzyme